MQKIFDLLMLGFAIIMVALLFAGCTVVPAYSGGVTVRSSGGYYHPPVYPYSPHGSTVQVQTKEDEQGLVSFRVSQSGLTEPEVSWVLRKVDELKVRCQAGGTMKQYEILSSERANPYPQSRSVRGDTTVRIEYHCSRGESKVSDKPTLKR